MAWLAWCKNGARGGGEKESGDGGDVHGLGEERVRCNGRMVLVMLPVM